MHEWESIVATNRPSFTSEFFQHAENLIKAAQNCPEEQEGGSAAPRLYPSSTICSAQCAHVARKAPCMLPIFGCIVRVRC